MGIENIHILSEYDDGPIAESRPLTSAELSAIRQEHEQGVHDRNKMVICPQCFPPK